MKTSLHILLFTLAFAFSSAAQVIINYQGNLTPQGVVDSIFPSNFVNPTNVFWNGNAMASTVIQPNCKTFQTLSGFPFDKGIYLTTSMGTGVSDIDLSAIATGTITNGGVLQFDFEALGDTLVVDYMFASAEYPTYVCSNFNDAFGFFIAGPGINGPYSNNAENIALIPNSNTPVAINTVNPGISGSAGNPSYCAQQDPNWVSNSVYYTTQFAGYSGETYNGGTVPMTARIPLQCGEIYTIKFAVGNVSDQALNSGVYINKCIFPVVCSADVNYEPPTNVNGSIEGCQDGGSLIFRRVGCSGNEDQSLTAQVTFSGTAQNGVDYTGVPSSITFSPFQTEIVVPLEITDDQIAEGVEDAMITVTTILPNGETVTSETTFAINDREELLTSSQNSIANCYEEETVIEVTVNQGTAPYSFSWSTGESTASVQVPVSDIVQTYTVQTTDACGDSTIETITVERNSPVSIELHASNLEYCPNQAITFNTTVNEENVSLNWDFGSATSSGYPSQVATQSTSVESAFEASTNVVVIASNGDILCNDTSSVQITVVTCGCTDPSSTNFNPLAVKDDGSCLPNKPTVTAPNVFTPFDNNTINNLFFLSTENAKYIELTILNRWGNVVFEGKGNQAHPPVWNGTDTSGKELSAGTYFYKYKVEGFSSNPEENILTGQGFVELIRN